MNPPKLEHASGSRFRLSGELSYATVPDLSGAAAALFAAEPVLHIDLQGVQRSDSAGVALLVEWMRLAHQRQCEIQYLNIPAQMLAIARVSSLDHILPLVRN